MTKKSKFINLFILFYFIYFILIEVTKKQSQNHFWLIYSILCYVIYTIKWIHIQEHSLLFTICLNYLLVFVESKY